jgi:uncharacterized RDD family membrane protein YckC
LSQPWGSQLVTGEAVALDLRTAALPSRVVSGAIDGALQLVLLLVLAGLTGALATQASEAATAAMFILVLVSVTIAYPVLFETVLRGRTPGKMAMGLRVVRDDGGPVGFRHAFVRGLTGAFIERPGITFFVGGVLTMLLNPQGKRIGDLLAGTVVLQERVSVRGGPVATMPPPLAGWAGSLDLSGLSNDLALSVRQFLARSNELTPQAREDLGGRLVAAVLAAVQPAPPPGTPGWAVLSAVLAERRRREELRLGARRAQHQPAGPAPGHGGTPGHGPAPGYGQAPGYGPAPRPAGSPAPRPDPPPARAEPPTTGPGGFVAPS